jgi:hypothetical protein
VFSAYTYTLETIIQAGHSNIRVLSVPIRTNPDLRPSRLVKSMGRYVWRSASTIVRIFATYRPLMFFWLIATFFTLLGLLFGGWSCSSSRVAARGMCSRRCSRRVGHDRPRRFPAWLSRRPAMVNRRLLENIDWRLRRLEDSTQTPRVAPIRRARIEHRSAAGWQLLRQNRTTNPIARHLMQGFLDAFDTLSAQVPVSPALEIGCGEGGCRSVSRGVVPHARLRHFRGDHRGGATTRGSCQCRRDVPCAGHRDD